jgi:hypothetical protein
MICRYRKLSWGVKANETEGKKWYSMILQRSDNQVPFSAVLQSPEPHELDLWKVYNTWVTDEMRTQAKPENYVAWRLSERQQKREKEDYIEEPKCLEEFGRPSGFRQYVVRPRQRGYRRSRLSDA